MTVKHILLTMAENLPKDATIYDAINQLEYTATIFNDVQPQPQKGARTQTRSNCSGRMRVGSRGG